MARHIYNRPQDLMIVSIDNFLKFSLIFFSWFSDICDFYDIKTIDVF